MSDVALAPEVAAHLSRLDATTLLGPASCQGSLKQKIAYYQHRGPRRRLGFIVLGATVLVANATLPMLSLLGSSLALTLTATLSSAALAVIAFFNFQRGWAGAITSWLQLEAAWNTYEVARVAALGITDPQAAITALNAATHALANRVADIVEGETRGYFDTIPKPTAPPGRGGSVN
jgi:hypothetical protein